MIRDKLILGIIVGLLADAVKLTFNYLAFKLGFTKVVFWQLVAALLLEKEYIHKPIALLVGGITDLIVASFYGVVFIYFIYLSGKVHLWIKGIGFGMIVWVSILGFILMQLIGDKLPQDPQGVLVTTAAHFFFGVSLAAFTRLLGKDSHFLVMN